MALAATTLDMATLSSRAGVVAVVAPYGDGGRHAQEYAKYGWESIAVTFPASSLPAGHRNRANLTGYRNEIVHEGGLRRTVKRLRYRGVSAVVAGSGLGVELADQLALALNLPGNDPATSSLRGDRGVQAAALNEAGVAAPRSLRTDSLAAALRWANFCRLPGYVLAVADSSVSVAPSLCRTTAQIGSAWDQLRRAAHRHSGTPDLVIQEHLSGQQYVVHTVSGPTAGQHAVTGVWAEHRTNQQIHAHSDLLNSHSLLARSLSQSAVRAVRTLGIETGPARCRLLFTTGRGPTLLSARAFAHPSPVDDLIRQATGTDHIEATVQVSATGWLRPASGRDGGSFVSRVSLVAPHDGVLDARLLRTVTSLPTVARVLGPLEAGAPVRRTVDRASSPGELVLSASSRHAIEEDIRVIRAIETLGLYDG